MALLAVPAAKLLDARLASLLLHLPKWAAVTAWLRHAVRYLASHTGLPALVVAALLVAVGYRLLKKSLRFAMEVCVIGAALVAMTQLGWIVW